MNANSLSSQASPRPTQTSLEPPKAYQIHCQNFYGRDFYVDEDVLIPRPESEQLIDMVLNLAGKSYLPGVKPPKRRLPPSPVILDVGTGSGCLAITLALELKNAKIYATDVSDSALKVAQKNAITHGAPITTIISYLLDKVNGSILPIPDLIIANLPYVDIDWPWLDQKSLSYEPSLALYAKDHGLALIKELLDEASALSIRYLVLEADPSQHRTLTSYASSLGYAVKSNGFALLLQLIK